MRNARAGAATGDWLLFIDADYWPEATLINDALDRIQDIEVMGGGSVLKMEDMPLHLTPFIGLWNGLSKLLGWAAGSSIFAFAVVSSPAFRSDAEVDLLSHEI